MASYTQVALAVGLVLALLTGGRPRHLAGKRFRLWPLLFFGLILQWVAGMESVPFPFAVLVASYAYLLTFVAANLDQRGAAIILIGIALNAVVITVDHGMPVRRAAVVSAGLSTGDERFTIDEVKHHLEVRGRDRLMPLADIVPVRPLGEVLSFGDLILSVGIIDLLVHLMRPSPSRRRRRGPVEIDLRDEPRDPSQLIDLRDSGREEMIGAGVRT